MPKMLTQSALIVVVTVSIAGCSGSTEDVRFGFCKELAVEMLGKPKSIAWTASNAKMDRLKDLTVTLDYIATRFAAEPKDGIVVCTYEQDEGSDYSMGDANPYEAYKTLPYSVKLNGQVLSQKKLNASTKTALLAQGKAFSGAIRVQADKAIKALSGEMDKLTNN